MYFLDRGKLAKEPEFFEDLFCDLSCFQEYRIRTSQRSLRVVSTGIFFILLILWFT